MTTDPDTELDVYATLTSWRRRTSEVIPREVTTGRAEHHEREDSNDAMPPAVATLGGSENPGRTTMNVGDFGVGSSLLYPLFALL